MTVIEIRPHRSGWKAFESHGVEPVFPEKDHAIDYAQNRACFRSGEVRIFDSTGNIERVISFYGEMRGVVDWLQQKANVASVSLDLSSASALNRPTLRTP